MAVTGLEGVVLLVGRVLFDGVLAVRGLDHVLDAEGGYARHKGVPAPRLGVLVSGGGEILASGGVLVLGGLGIVLGVLPLLGRSPSRPSSSPRPSCCTTSGRFPRTSARTS